MAKTSTSNDWIGISFSPDITMDANDVYYGNGFDFNPISRSNDTFFTKMLPFLPKKGPSFFLIIRRFLKKVPFLLEKVPFWNKKVSFFEILKKVPL